VDGHGVKQEAGQEDHGGPRRGRRGRRPRGGTWVVVVEEIVPLERKGMVKVDGDE